MATIDSVKLPDNSTYDITDNYSGYQKQTLTTPITVDGTQETTVEGALSGLNDYGDALADNLVANEESGAKNKLDDDDCFAIDNMDKSGHTFTSNNTDPQSYFDFNIAAYDGATLIQILASEIISSTGRYEYSINIPNNINRISVFHNGSQRNIGVTFYTSVTGTGIISLDVTGVDPTTVGGLSFENIMLRDARVIDPTFAPYAKTNKQLTDDVSGVSNRNFVDNAFFTVNQRGATTVTSGYGADRWLFGGGVSGSNIVFAPGSATLTNVQMQQYFENQVPNGVYTLSVKKSDGTIYHGTINKIDDVSEYEPINNADVLVRYNATYKTFVVSTYGKGTSTFVATKFEPGSVSTLHLDVVPDPTIELLKCQRYFYRLTNANQISISFASSTDVASVIFNLPVPMRTTPTFTYGGAFYLRYMGANEPVTNIVEDGSNNERVGLALYISGTLTIGQAGYFNASNTSSFLDFSADL